MEENKMRLGDVLNAMNDGTIADGDIIRNLGTDERVIIDNGDLKYLTFNDYISNVVPLVNGMIDAWWVMEERGTLAITPEKAIDLLTNEKEVVVKGGVNIYKVRTVQELFEALDELGITGTEYLASRGDVQKVNDIINLDDEAKQSRGRTSESEAWAMLMDRYLFDKPVKEIAGKFGTSLRNAYYILDGTYYPEVYKRFNQLVETGELYIVKDSDQ